MAKAGGPGGIFFKTLDPAALAARCAKDLGLDVSAWNHAKFDEDGSRNGRTPWTPFAADTAYFGSAAQTFMVKPASMILTRY